MRTKYLYKRRIFYVPGIHLQCDIVMIVTGSGRNERDMKERGTGMIETDTEMSERDTLIKEDKGLFTNLCTLQTCINVYIKVARRKH